MFAIGTVRAADAQILRQLCRPLERGLGLIEIRDRLHWAALTHAAPGLGPCPDLTRGSAVCLASWLGERIDGSPPAQIDSVQVHRGAAKVSATFVGGNYHPVAAGFVDVVYVPRLREVLVVEINGTPYFP